MNTFSKPLFTTTLAAISLIVLFTGCKNVSYLNAYHQNKDKFTGRAESDALFLIDVKDDLILLKDISNLAKDKAYSKAVFNYSDSAAFDYKDFQTSLNLLAIKKQVKMPNAVSEKNHEVYNTVFEVRSQKEFDRVYLETTSKTLKEIVNKMETYLSKGEDDSLKDFIAKNIALFKNQQKKVDSLKNTIQAFNE